MWACAGSHGVEFMSMRPDFGVGVVLGANPEIGQYYSPGIPLPQIGGASLVIGDWQHSCSRFVICGRRLRKMGNHPLKALVSTTESCTMGNGLYKDLLWT